MSRTHSHGRKSEHILVRLAVPVPGLRFTAVFLAALAVAGTAFAGPGGQVSVSSSYFPLQKGNTWVYARHDMPIDPITTQEVTVAERTSLGEHEIFLMSNYLFRFVPSDVWFFNDSEGTTAEVRWPGIGPDTGSWYVWSEPDRRVKLPSFVEDCFHGSAGRFVGDHTLSVPAGTFKNVRTIEYDHHPCIDDGVLSESFAPGVGLIQRRISSRTGEQTWSLQSAVVNGLEWIGDGGASGAAMSPTSAVATTTWGAIKSVYSP